MSPQPTSPTNPEERTRVLVALVAVLVVGAVARAVYVGRVEVVPHDPWRHLLLIHNLQEGAGFTLFEGQSYIWYNPPWYYLAAWVGSVLDPLWLSALLSLAAVGLAFGYLRRVVSGWVPAAVGAGLLAAFGPMIAFTCTLGAEALAVALLLGALWLGTWHQRPLALFGSGLLFGLALVSRMNLLFNGFLFLPALRRPKHALAFGSGAALPLALTWWRNHRVISAYDYLFTWDGMATRTSDYDLISTLIPQHHPAVEHATRVLYEKHIPYPEWLVNPAWVPVPGEVQWAMVVFMALGVGCLLASRKLHLIAAGLVTLVYFIFLDSTLSSNFFRHYIAVFPVLFFGVAHLVGQLSAAEGRVRRAAAPVTVGVMAVLLGSGLRYYEPGKVAPLEAVTITPEMMDEMPGDRFMVNSGFYHPEGLMYRYPDRRFIGMPVHPDQFDHFHTCYPLFETILWHDGHSAQNTVVDALIASGRYRVADWGYNRHRLRYRLVEPARPGPE